MGANTTPIFTLTPVIGHAYVNTANLNRDGSGTLGTVLIGATNGTRVDRVKIISSGSSGSAAVAACVIRLFVDVSGSAALYGEVAVPASSPSATVVGFVSSIDFTGEYSLDLPNGVALKASTTVSQMFDVWAEGANY